MAITYTWEVSSLKTKAEGDNADAVIQTYWKKTGTDDDGNVGSFSGATPLDIPDADEEGYIAYADLTETQVLGWIKNIVSGSGSSNYMDHINEQIEKQIDEKAFTQLEVQTNDLPWSETSGSSVIPEEAPTAEEAAPEGDGE